jgi:hypothetical protein
MLEGRRLPLVLMLLKISCWGEMGEVLMDVMNQASRGSERAVPSVGSFKTRARKTLWQRDRGAVQYIFPRGK